MAKTPRKGHTPYLIRDSELLAKNLGDVARQSGELLQAYMSSNQTDNKQSLLAREAPRMGQLFAEFAKHYSSNPQEFASISLDFWQRHINLWQASLKKLSDSDDTSPVIEPKKGDRRFGDDEWRDNPLFDFMKQSYLITSQWVDDVIQQTPDINEATRQKTSFYAAQISNALSPSNFLFTNPAVLRKTLETNGENLISGMQNLAKDIERGHGSLAIRQTDMDAFEVGENLAITPGKIVFQNHLIQLIQYAPATTGTYKKPLLIIPPWINKYYILDLTPEKSFVKWAVDQGQTVFMISWVNPGPDLSHLGFDDYLEDGIIAALGAIEAQTGERHVNAVGYCIGGTLLAMALAYMAAVKDTRITSATFITTQVDFELAGDLRMFVDEEQIIEIESEMAHSGVFDGRKMASVFNLLRSNDLIWSFVVNNYLLGKTPFPFDLLYWNSDSTSMPAAIHSSYLRNCYLNNTLSQGTMELKGVKLDFSKVKIPVYTLATREDHIAPAASVYKGSQLFGGPVKFVLAASGHIAGVVNPPIKQKYEYWTNSEQASALEPWFEEAQSHPGSWWPDWHKWISRKSSPKIAARTPGNGAKNLEEAPGSYVKKKL